MSSLQVANLLFESTGNNRIEYSGSNTFNMYAGNNVVFTANSSSITFPTLGNLSIGNSTVNSTVIQAQSFISGNVSTNSSTLSIGNSTVNTQITQNTMRLGNSSVTFTVASNGNVGIGGNTTPTVDLYVNGSAAGAIGTLTDSANIAVDMATFNNFTVTLGGNRNIDNPTNLVPGQSGIMFLVQDGTGGRTLSWGSYWKFTTNTAPSLTGTANSVDCVSYVVRNSTNIVTQFIEDVG